MRLRRRITGSIRLRCPFSSAALMLLNRIYDGIFPGVALIIPTAAVIMVILATF